MTESTLSTLRSESLQAIGDYLGYGRNFNIWNREQTAQVTRIMRSAERAFYEPKLIDQKGDVYVWSFLILVLSVSLVANTTDYDLPDTFGGFTADRLNFTTVQTWPLMLISGDRYLEKKQYNRSTGLTQPQVATVSPKAFTAATGQRWTLSVWPTPISGYTVNGSYRLNPDSISAVADYPMGGEPHSETLLASYLAAAELEKGAPGPLAARFQELLAASIAYDRALGAK